MPSNFSAQATDRIEWRVFYSAAALAIFGWAAWQRFTLPLDPIADPDTWGYLAPALRKLTGAAFGHTNGRNFLYPGFVFLLLRLFGDFRAIAIAQHLLGLVAGAMLLVTWRCARVFLRNARLAKPAHDLLGLIGAAIFLCAAETIHIEMQLRPEGVCAFLLSVNIWLVIQFALAGLVNDRRRAAVAYGIAAVFSAVVLASVKPMFGFVAVLALMPLAIWFFRRGRLAEKAVVAAGAIAGAALLLMPEHVLSRADEKSRTFTPATLFTIHANLIRDQMADDLQSGAKLAYPRDWLQRVQAELSDEITKSAGVEPRYHVSNGFSPDYLMYNPTSIAAQLRSEFGGDVARLCAFYRFYYWRIWLHRPLAVLQKIARQMSIFYAPICPAYNRSKTFPLAEEYTRGVRSLDLPQYRDLWKRYGPAGEFMNRAALLGRSAASIEQPGYVRKLLGALAGTYLPLFFVTILLGAAAFIRREYRTRFGWLAALSLFLFLYNFATCLEVAVVHLLEYRRYITVQMYFTLLAQFFALWFVIENAVQIRRQAKLSVPETNAR